MQKRLKRGIEPVYLPEDFPMVHFYHTQTYLSAADLHVHDCAEIGICLEGSGVFFIGGGVYPFREGDISAIRPGDPHIAQSADDCPSRWWFLSYAPAYFGAAVPEASRVFHDGDCHSLLTLLRKERDRGENADRQACDWLLRLFLRRSGRMETQGEMWEYKKELDMVLPAIQWVARHYDEAVGTDGLAAVCHLSTSYFRTLFRACVGVPPLAYLTRVRMLAAADQLRQTDKPVARIAADVGYGSLSSFNRQFQAAFGIAPLAFRKGGRQ